MYLAKRLLGSMAHSSLVRDIRKFQEVRELERIRNNTYPDNNLLYLSYYDLCQVFDDAAAESEWNDAARIAQQLELPEMMGGVNRGDQRAIFYLIKYFRPRNVLEVGTHIGCSTVHIALGLQNIPGARLTSVDVADVNDTDRKHWLRYNSKRSPRELMSMIGAEARVKFVSEDSLSFLSNCNEKFDFIFLDGSHKAKVVFQEVPLAMRSLNRNGIILLHDYFPDGKPLWKGTTAIPGPYLAVNRIIGEQRKISVVPFGELPWKTKGESNYSSLALLTRNHQ